MSETTEDILDGITCQVCGQWMPDCFIKLDNGEEKFNDEAFDNPPGHPRTCPDCKE